MSTDSIGIFDSGVGGLGVLSEVRERLSEADLVYVADQAFAPYGERDLASVRKRAFAIAAYLLDAGSTTIVVACNSASAAALHELRKRFPNVQFVGMEPAVKPAVDATRRGTIGVLATEATFQGALFASVVDRHANGIAVVPRACPGLAAAIEDGTDPGELIDRYTADLLDEGADTIVLGCTHYSFVADRIRRAVGDGVHVIDPAPAVALQVERVRAGRDAGGTGSTLYVTTGQPERFEDQIQRLTGIRRPAVGVAIGT